MRITTSGSFNNLEKYLKKDRRVSMDALGRAIVEALRSTTPSKSGKTANSWGYRINKTGRGEELEIFNTNINKGVNIAIIIHYGHGTGTGDMYLRIRILLRLLIRHINLRLIKS